MRPRWTIPGQTGGTQKTKVRKVFEDQWLRTAAPCRPPIVKKDPHHRRGSFFRSRRGSFPRQRPRHQSPSIRCADRILNRQLRAPSWCLRASVVTARFDCVPSRSTLNFGPAFGGPSPWDDISLTNFGPAAVVSARSGAHNLGLWTLDFGPKKSLFHSAIKIQICQDQFLGIRD
jgi:hypothetical protein